MELIYALQNKMPYGVVKNKKGNFVTPTLAATSKAADTNLPDDMSLEYAPLSKKAVEVCRLFRNRD